MLCSLTNFVSAAAPRSLLLANSAGGIFNVDRLWQFLHTEFNSNKEISDNVGIDSEVQKSGRQKRKPGWLADYETY
jgi:hypothetical protein